MGALRLGAASAHHLPSPLRLKDLLLTLGRQKEEQKYLKSKARLERGAVVIPGHIWRAEHSQAECCALWPQHLAAEAGGFRIHGLHGFQSESEESDGVGDTKWRKCHAQAQF